MGRTKAVKAAMLLALALVVILTGCSQKNNDQKASPSASPSQTAAAGTSSPPASASAEPGIDTSKEVELVWYFPVPELSNDMTLVQEAVNKIAKEKINATVKLMPINLGEYNDKMNTIVAAGEKADIIWTSSWSFSYINNVSKGAFAPLDDLLAKYGPDILPQMPGYVSEGVKVAGVTYGIANYQTMTTIPGYIIQQEYLDKYKFDVSTLKRPQDLEPFLEQVKNGSPGVVPYAMHKSGELALMLYDAGYETILPGISVVRKSDPYKVLKQQFVPEYEQYLDMVRGWYTKGYINQDAPTIETIADLKKTGKVVSYFFTALKPGGEAEDAKDNGGHPVQYVITEKPQVTTADVLGTLQAISARSENKERAMMFLNLVNTDKELYNLLAIGIEGKHYTLNANGTAKMNAGTGYTAYDWVMGNTFNGIQPEEKGTDVLEQTKQLNETAEASAVLGFVFDAEPVTSQIANVTAINKKYEPGLNTGAVDRSKVLDEYRSQLDKAGVDDIIAELQRQLDAWVKENNK